ncbi:DUF6506 family protein [Micromonospora sp. NPDC049175]|uniref:DUF6506 family protein n=1 Tax=Micromonospora sp. NPDC049175 TaxID=3364266 RepID=UPI0037118331
MTISWAYIYEHPGSDPVDDRVVLDRGGQRTYLVPVPDPSTAPAVAVDLVAEGVALVELCGGFALTAAARVAEAVGGRVPVGHVTFAVDSVRGATRYGERLEADQAPSRHD